MENLLNQITDYLLTQSWQIAILVAVIAAVNLMLKNRSAHVRYLLWLIVLAKCLVPPLLTVPVAVLPQERLAEPVPMPADRMPAVFEVMGTPAAETPVSPATPVVAAPTLTIAERPARLTPRQWLGFGWVVGVAAFAFFAVIKALQTNRWLRRDRKPLPAELQSGIKNLFPDVGGIKVFPKVWLVEGIGQPFVWGLLRGNIYLPADFVKIDSAEHRRGILGHEISHILRFDAAVNILQIIAQAVFWFHPFVWWANKKNRAEREKCCDEMAIARLGAKAKDYSSAIVETLIVEHESTRPVPSLAVAGPVKNIEERIKTMMKPGKKFYKRPSLVTATVVLLLALLTVPTALVLTARAGTQTETTGPVREKAIAVSRARARQTELGQPSPAMVVRRVWADAADPYFMGAPSPDGKYLSYVDWESGDLAIRELASGKSRRLTNEGWGKGRHTYSIFSPDSKYVACRWRGRDGGGLRIIGLDGSERRFIKHPEGEGIAILRPTNWSTDGKHILALGGAMWDDSDKAFKFLKILFVSVEDGDARVLKTIERLPHRKRSGRFQMSLSPDGRYVAYSFPPADNSGRGDIWVFGTDGGPEIQVVEHPADDFVLAWSPDGNRIVFASDRTGTMGIWAIDVSDGKPEGVSQLLKPEIGRFHRLGLTRNGAYYYGVFSGAANVYVAPFDPQKGTVAGKAVVAVNRYEGSNWAPDWSPDGRYLACLSSGPGAAPRLVIQSMETGEVREITPELKEFNVHSLRWSADGRSLLGAGSPTNGPWGALQIDVKTGEVTTIAQGPAIAPESAPDGKTLFYIQNLAKKGGRIVRRELKSQEEKELYSSREFISALTLSSDGKHLAFSKGGALIVLDVESGEARELVKANGQITIAWTPNGSHLLYGLRGEGDEPGQLWRISSKGGKPKKLDLEIPYLDHIRVHPDGRRITFMGKAEKDTSEVWVMENFLPAAIASAKTQ